jgi:hypothetical protein
MFDRGLLRIYCRRDSSGGLMATRNGFEFATYVIILPGYLFVQFALHQYPVRTSDMAFPGALWDWVGKPKLSGEVLGVQRRSGPSAESRPRAKESQSSTEGHTIKALFFFFSSLMSA